LESEVVEVPYEKAEHENCSEQRKDDQVASQELGPTQKFSAHLWVIFLQVEETSTESTTDEENKIVPLINTVFVFLLNILFVEEVVHHDELNGSKDTAQETHEPD